ncbi:similar to Saccharomyces cerevisiae YBL017C PEP1 Type I transmembrane sorting receptor for multiple vacuolar hydrolases [Maudiozyma saulgeensis]|uniref:Similar to Saccharomyces cerevisiae YBL017C PEP1 Type I transmembrane sorting receptor for multiple vacuolar hydrolases n=1 Tax=Maudiozyma saulgeensis TaxID=1789683 RepID=A0A1X7QYI0_9SACH|nr:similar to Saccharomyces cerevisiae YBL017C PEP1 Type I transmembrane sorting receptor for multiple vacuolar hydrolases [Kazachstania saulgeensis]
MRYVHTIGVLLLLWFYTVVAKDDQFIPKVTKTKNKHMQWFAIFDDSTTVLRTNDDKLQISQDNGENWSDIKGINDKINFFSIDENFAKFRAFAYPKNKNYFYITIDKGLNWKKYDYNIPNTFYDKKHTPSCFVISHAIEQDEFFLTCSVCKDVKKDKKDEDKKKNEDEDKDDNPMNRILDNFDDFFSRPDTICEDIILKSNNGGKSFDLFQPPFKVDEGERKLSFHTGSLCQYAKISEKSTVQVDETSLICNFEKIQRSSKNNGEIKMISQLFTIIGNNVKKLDIFEDMTVNSVQVLNSHIVVITQEDKFNDYSNKKVWVSNDLKTFDEAYIPTDLTFNEMSFSLYEDSLGRIVIPIAKSDIEELGEKEDPYGNKYKQTRRNFKYNDVLVSDSTGLKFSDYDWIDRSVDGHTSVELIDYLKGTIINSVFAMRYRFQDHDQDNTKQFVSSTKISFDNGVSWDYLKIVDPENKDKYNCNIDDPESCSILSINHFNNYRTPSAGILVMSGVLCDGYAYNFDDAKTFVSRDGGKTWKKALDFPTISTVGDAGNIIVAVPHDSKSDGDTESEVYYSLDQGETWNEYQFEEPFYPALLINTTPDGSGSNFILEAFGSGNVIDGRHEQQTFFYTLDFSDAFDGKKCDKNDFETFYLNSGDCVNGAKYSYRRRKYDSKCLVKEVFTDLELDEEICTECTDADYECSFEFTKDHEGHCVPDFKLLEFSGICANKKEKNMSLKPRRKIVGNKCKKELDINPMSVTCGILADPGRSSDKITVTENVIDGQPRFYEYFDTDQDESLIIGTTKYEFFISHDGGKTIKKIDTNNERIIEIVYNPYSNSSAYLFSSTGSIFITHDRGYTFFRNELPDAIQLGFPLNFHPEDPNTFIYYGGKGCENIYSSNCRVMSYITRDGGKTFEELLEGAVHCEFTGELFDYPADKDMMNCQIRDLRKNAKSLVSSTDYFKNDKKTVFENIIGYMSSGGFTIVAVTHEKNELRTYVTLDGEEYAEAKLPQDLSEISQKTFTVLGTNTGSIFLHMGTTEGHVHPHGDLLKSNSNGTSFVTLQKNVNSNMNGQVDFEKIQGLEGIILINVVENPEDSTKDDIEKKLKTKITFNDGADWSYITPPSKDSEGKKYNCKGGSLEKCSLNLHGYTERDDARDTFSSGSAHGMLFAKGNVGEFLVPISESSTFLTTDGGITWKEVKKGAYQWEFGDHGGILALVPDTEETDVISYSLDFGKTWNDYKFSSEKVVVKDIVTVPQDSALRFLLVGQSSNVQGASTKTYAIDFSGSFQKQCDFEINNNKNDDFAFISIGSSQDKCLFGHKEEYLKKVNTDCFVGNIPLSRFSKIVKNCTCTRSDFECDYNFIKAKDGTCKLVEGLSTAPASDICTKNPDLIEFSDLTGYRKIPLSTCQGGLKLDVASDTYPCPGKEAEFNKKYGISGRSFFLIFFIPFVLLSALLWFIYDRGIRRNGGFSRFGEIRLGDENQLIENNETDRIVNSTVRFGLVVFSGIHTGFEMVKRSIRGVSERFRGRMSSRGPTYSSLMNDQFLDEADDLLAGHDEDANDLSSFMDHDTNFDIDEESNVASDVANNDNDNGHVQPYSDNLETDNTSQQQYTDDAISDDVPAPLVEPTTEDAEVTNELSQSDRE